MARVLKEKKKKRIMLRIYSNFYQWRALNTAHAYARHQPQTKTIPFTLKLSRNKKEKEKSRCKYD